MSTSIIIGEVPDEVREELAARAAVCGRTLEDYVRDELLALAKRPSAAVWMARVRARKDALQSQQNAACAGAGLHPGSGHSDSDPPSAPRASEGLLLDVRRDVG
jgi:plasmid stability protein